MSDNKPANEGYSPQEEKGYQPKPSSSPSPAQGGYQPNTSEGGGPTNPPPKKK